MLPRRPDPTAGAKGAHCATSARSVKQDWQRGSRAHGKSAFFLRDVLEIIGWYVPSSRCEAVEHVSSATSRKDARAPAVWVRLTVPATGDKAGPAGRDASRQHLSTVNSDCLSLAGRSIHRGRYRSHSGAWRQPNRSGENFVFESMDRDRFAREQDNRLEREGLP